LASPPGSGILFVIYVGYFAGAYFEWWEINDE
jgi:hypothetical protein